MSEIKPSYIFSHFFCTKEASSNSPQRIYKGLFARRGGNGLYKLKALTINASRFRPPFNPFSLTEKLVSFFNRYSGYTLSREEVIEKMDAYADDQRKKYRVANIIIADGGYRMPIGQLKQLLTPKAPN